MSRGRILKSQCSPVCLDILVLWIDGTQHNWAKYNNNIIISVSAIKLWTGLNLIIRFIESSWVANRTKIGINCLNWYNLIEWQVFISLYRSIYITTCTNSKLIEPKGAESKLDSLTFPLGLSIFGLLNMSVCYNIKFLIKIKLGMSNNVNTHANMRTCICVWWSNN